MNLTEPKEAFPYKPPSNKLKKQYKYLFDSNLSFKIPLTKLLFDKVFSLFFLLISTPIILILIVLNFIEGIVIQENKGPLFFYYYGVSGGKKFKKWKIRIIKNSFIDQNLKEKGDWHAFKNEWMPSARTYLGYFVKKFYLDELPQFYLIFIGKMTFVGPRPLALHHYERDLKNGNITRKILRGGLLGYGHVRKGTEEFGDPTYEFEYADFLYKKNSIQILILDLKIIFKGASLVLKGGGH